MTMPLTFTTPKPATIFAPLKQLLRPIFFVVLGLHAVFLFMPLPQEEKLKTADDKKDPIKVTQVPTAGLTKPSAAKVAIAPAKPVTQTTSVSKTTATPAVKPTNSGLPVVEAGTTTTPPATATTPAPPGSATPAAAPVSTVDAEEELFKVLAGIPAPDSSDPAATNAAVPEQFEQPDRFLTPPNADGDREWRNELKGTPVYANGETPEYFYETLFEGELKGKFQEMKKVGEYGGGALYHLKQGSYEAFVSLVPVKLPPGTVGLGSIIAVWSKDPRTL
jgi:hypothetical protein